MSTIEYPRTVYILTSGYSIRKITLVRPYSAHSNYGGYTKGGLFYRDRDVHATKAKAIKAGRSTLARRKKSLEAGLALVAKQAAALDREESGKPAIAEAA